MPETDQQIGSRDPEAYRREALDGLRQMLDWLEATPAARLPRLEVYDYVAPSAGQETAERLIERRRAFGGEWQPSADDADFRLTRQFGPRAAYVLFTRAEEVCEKRTSAVETWGWPDSLVGEEAA